MPALLPTRETITGYVKVDHVSPLHLVEEELRKMNIGVQRAEFVRYADARTALLSNSVDVTGVGAHSSTVAKWAGAMISIISQPSE